MSVKMYAGIRLDTGQVIALAFVDNSGDIQGISIPSGHGSTGSYLLTQWDSVEHMLRVWGEASSYALVELKDFPARSLFNALKEVALDQLEKHGEA